jgi:hypothetical protein
LTGQRQAGYVRKLRVEQRMPDTTDRGCRKTEGNADTETWIEESGIANGNRGSANNVDRNRISNLL